MKTQLLLIGVLGLALGGLGCGADEAEGETQLELLTWWSQKSELEAIAAVIAVNGQKHPHVNIRLLTADSQEAMARDVNNRLADGTPPTAFQVNLGGNALQWQDTAESLNTRAKAWASSFKSSILERVTGGDKLLGVPLALTRQNNAYYNMRVLEELGLDIPVGRDGLAAWLIALAEKGYTHPLCIGDRYNWVSAHTLFEDIIPGYVGAEHSQKFWSGQLDANDELFAEALDYAATLKPYWNTDFAQIDWDMGLKRVMQAKQAPDEQCVVTPMGDWGGAVLADDYRIGSDFEQRSWPGAEDLFVLAGDAFVTPRGVESQAAALDFFDTLASEAGQIAFNTKKGSVPARTMTLAQRASFGPLTQANMADLARGEALPAYKVLGSSEFPWEELAKLSHDFILVGDKQPLIDFIAENYELLAP